MELENDPASWDLPPMTMGDAKRLIEGPFGDALHRIVISHMTYIVFGVREPTGEPRNLRNGTCFFVQTPRRLFVVTARHVVEGFRLAREREPKTVCQIGNLMVDPVERLIGEGQRADIATLDIQDYEIEKIDRHNRKRPITLWPPDPPDFDDTGVLLAGYPAAATISDGPRSRSFGIYAATGVAQRVTDWQLSCTIEWDNSLPPPLGQGCLPSRNFDTRGMSGGPMLAIRKRSGIVSFPVAGVISEGREATDTIVAERADRILADGTIRI